MAAPVNVNEGLLGSPTSGERNAQVAFAIPLPGSSSQMRRCFATWLLRVRKQLDQTREAQGRGLQAKATNPIASTLCARAWCAWKAPAARRRERLLRRDVLGGGRLP